MHFTALSRAFDQRAALVFAAAGRGFFGYLKIAGWSWGRRRFGS